MTQEERRQKYEDIKQVCREGGSILWEIFGGLFKLVAYILIFLFSLLGALGKKYR